MTRPLRIQRPYIWPHPRPHNTVNVARPTRYGNPYRTGNPAADVAAYRQWLTDPAAEPIRLGHRIYQPLTEADRIAIAGKNLACHCGYGSECHADVLLDWANTDPAAALFDVRSGDG